VLGCRRLHSARASLSSTRFFFWSAFKDLAHLSRSVFPNWTNSASVRLRFIADRLKPVVTEANHGVLREERGFSILRVMTLYYEVRYGEDKGLRLTHINTEIKDFG
jgi:hypothetical protein